MAGPNAALKMIEMTTRKRPANSPIGSNGSVLARTQITPKSPKNLKPKSKETPAPPPPEISRAPKTDSAQKLPQARAAPTSTPPASSTPAKK